MKFCSPMYCLYKLIYSVTETSGSALKNTFEKDKACVFPGQEGKQRFTVEVARKLLIN